MSGTKTKKSSGTTLSKQPDYGSALKIGFLNHLVRVITRKKSRHFRTDHSKDCMICTGKPYRYYKKEFPEAPGKHVWIAAFCFEHSEEEIDWYYTIEDVDSIIQKHVDAYDSLLKPRTVWR